MRVQSTRPPEGRHEPRRADSEDTLRRPNGYFVKKKFYSYRITGKHTGWMNSGSPTVKHGARFQRASLWWAILGSNQ